eukprot:2964523-Karenia_brevis.AAC.1
MWVQSNRLRAIGNGERVLLCRADVSRVTAEIINVYGEICKVPMGFIFHFAELVDEASDDLNGQFAQHMYVSGYSSEIAQQNRLEDRT